MRTLSIGGRIVRVAVREGNPDWPPLLLCNGIGASLELFQPFVDALDPQRAVIRFDMPGIGGSPAPVVPYHLATLPSLLSGLLDQLGYEQADVLGISWGGGLAQQFALRCPARVRRLVLVATGTGALMVPGNPRVLLRMLTPRRHRDPGHAARIASELYGGSVRDDPALARDLLHATTTRLGPSTGYYYQLLSSIAWTSLPRLPRLRPPTLILAGDDDPIIPVINARIMHRLIPRSELVIYSGGHLELATDAERMAPIVEAFLTAARLPVWGLQLGPFGPKIISRDGGSGPVRRRAVADRRYRGREHLGVGQVERPVGRIQPDVGDADLHDVPAQLAAHRPRLDQHRVTDVDRPGQQQDHACEHVGEALLRRDADRDRGERATDQKLGHRDAEQLQGDQDRGQAAEQDDGVADDGSV